MLDFKSFLEGKVNKVNQDSIRALWGLYMGSIYKLQVEHLGPYKELKAMIVDSARLRGDEEIVDLGCGTGGIIQEIVDRGHRGRICGFDRDQEALRVASERFAELENVRMIKRDLNAHNAIVTILGEGSVDRVASNLALYPLKDPTQAIDQAYRLLRPGGLFVVNNLFNPDVDAVICAHEVWLGEKATEEERQYHEDYLWAYKVMILVNHHIKALSHGGTFHLWPAARLVQELENVGFKVEYVDPSTYAGTACLAVGCKA